MRLEFAFFADAADIGRSGKLSLVGGNIETIQAVGVPVTILALVLVAFFTVPESEVGVEHKLGLTVEAPSGEALISVNQIASMIPQANAHGLPVRYMPILNLGGLTVNAFGKHTVHLIVDGEEAGIAPFVVVPFSPTNATVAATS